MILRSLLALLSALIILTACAGPGQGPMTEQLAMRQILSLMDCGSVARQPAMKVISSLNALDSAIAPIASLSGHSPREQMRVSFDRELLIQISMGQKSTGGYSLALAVEQATLNDGWVDVPVQWNVPAKGMMLTQALTSPCLFVALPRQDYEGVRVLDQQGVVRAQVLLK
jgi:hypothetical protein